VANDSGAATELSAAEIRDWFCVAAAELRRRSPEINALNVFPVPDSDTGSNLAQTFAEAAAAATACVDDHPTESPLAGDVLQAAAAAAVLGARGNSGVIAAQVLRSVADAAAGASRWQARQLSDGLRRAAIDAYSAVADPVEGTMLTVLRAAAHACGQHDDLPTLSVAVVRAAEEALWHTPEQLAELARAGVVDAGGLGLLVVLDVLAEVVTGAKVAHPREMPVVRPGALLHGAREMGSEGYEYEVQYLLDAPAEAIEPLRVRLSEVGDSVVVVGTVTSGSDRKTWNVHVHVSDVGAAIEAGLAAGHPHRISVVAFSDEADGAHAETPTAPATPRTALVALAPDAGSAHVLTGEGVRVLAAVPHPAEVGPALASLGAVRFVLFHDREHTAQVAEVVAATRARGTRVAVIPVRSWVQALAAVAVHEPVRDFDDDVVAMAEAAAATRYAEVTIADSDGLTSVGACHAGDVLGFIDGEIVEIGKDVQDVALSLADRALGVGAELLTLLVGAPAPRGLGEIVTAHVRARSQFTEVSCYDGEQLDRPLIIGIE
jgi:DAK2 domain fusion protein YloV